jgi:hypothetical protein
MATKLQRRINIQKFTANFTTGDTSVSMAGNIDVSFNIAGTRQKVKADTNAVFNISCNMLYLI